MATGRERILLAFNHGRKSGSCLSTPWLMR